MTANMLNGDENVVGNVTSGGTESILMAMKACRDLARELKPHITEPEVVGRRGDATLPCVWPALIIPVPFRLPPSPCTRHLKRPQRTLT